MLLVFGAKKIKDSTCLAIRNGHYRIAALLLVCYAALTGDVNTLEMLLDKSLECYDWLQQFVDESVPIATVVENIRWVNQKQSFRRMFYLPYSNYKIREISLSTNQRICLPFDAKPIGTRRFMLLPV
jgi:hypothetical protein